MTKIPTSIFSEISSNLIKRTRSDIVQYGTAGFRDIAEKLGYIVFRMGLLSVLRSKSKDGKVIGLMITASHNPESDNGIKLIDPLGEMLDSSWETIATQLANVDDSALNDTLNNIMIDNGINWDREAWVYLGRDTRSSSLNLAEAAKRGIGALGGKIVDYGIVTTPMLHFFVAERNLKGKKPEEVNYFEKLGTAFEQLNNSQNTSNDGNYTKTINFDGANGVGANCIKTLIPYLKNMLSVKLFNDGAGRLNHLCGADYVKVYKKIPDGLPIEENAKVVSVDGDADRIIYSYIKHGALKILDGDKIATLLAAYLIDLLRATQLNLTLGLVHTAYANSAATNYVTNTLKVPLACTETGVKHLHHKAIEFDIGVYFEANGHGTVVYSKKAISDVENLIKNADTEEKKASARKLNDFINLTNQVVGDAICDMLLVETVLKDRRWSLEDWDRCYTDLPNRLQKVKIKDRNVVTTTDAGRKCLTPVGLQNEVDRLVSQYRNGRAFVRASGTEDVVRIYAEAETEEQADKLALEVCRAVYELAGGIGEPPK